MAPANLPEQSYKSRIGGPSLQTTNQNLVESPQTSGLLNDNGSKQLQAFLSQKYPERTPLNESKPANNYETF